MYPINFVYWRKHAEIERADARPESGEMLT